MTTRRRRQDIRSYAARRGLNYSHALRDRTGQPQAPTSTTSLGELLPDELVAALQASRSTLPEHIDELAAAILAAGEATTREGATERAREVYGLGPLPDDAALDGSPENVTGNLLITGTRGSGAALYGFQVALDSAQENGCTHILTSDPLPAADSVPGISVHPNATATASALAGALASVEGEACTIVLDRVGKRVLRDENVLLALARVSSPDEVSIVVVASPDDPVREHELIGILVFQDTLTVAHEDGQSVVTSARGGERMPFTPSATTAHLFRAVS